MRKTTLLLLNGIFLASFALAREWPDAGGEHEYAVLDWNLIERDIKGWGRLPRLSTTQSVNTAACILPGDKDPTGVVIRRTRALIADLAAEGVDLSEEQRELDELAAHYAKLNNSTPETRFAAFAAVHALNRRVSLRNPLLKGIRRLVFVGHEATPVGPHGDGWHMCDQYFGFNATCYGSTIGDGLYILENPFSDHPVARDITSLGPGGYLSPDVSWDGSTIAFAYTRCERGAKRVRWEEGTCYHIFTCAADGSNLRKLTSGPWNDFDPCWLPNGRIAFISERRGGYGRCHGRPVPTYTLHSMFDDGTDIVRLSHHETNEWHPSVDANGMIVYTRWDYVDRGAGQAHHAWTTYPDGRDPREVNGNTRLHAYTTPKMEMNVRQIPGSRKYVAVATPHHGWAAGSLIMIDPSVPDDGEMSAVRRITPEHPFAESEMGTVGGYATPWPLSEKYFICVYDGNANSKYGESAIRHYVITLVDVFGNKTRLYSHPTISCLDPMPLQARERPPVLAHQTLEGRPEKTEGPAGADRDSQLPKMGEIGLVNVYDTRIPFPTNETITALRVWQLFPKTQPLQQHPWLGPDQRQIGRQCLGTVPVEKDGSAYFTAPVGVPLFFQALRADGCAVQNMRSDTYLHPGERLMCAGCHEPKENTRRTASSALPAAMRREPSSIKPGPDGSAPFNYARLVQPVLDAKCVSCHGERRSPKAPDLRAGDWRKDEWGFSTSWKSLLPYSNYFVKGIIDSGKRLDWEFFEPAYTMPGRHLAIGAPLRKMLDAGHHGVKLTHEERERLVLWMDSNAQYIAHDTDPEAQRDGKTVKPELE